jgi:tetratricopeptide (TPR) repeat protein
MKLFGPRKPKDSSKNTQGMEDPRELPEPQNPAEYLRRGYAFYARGLLPEAEADFRKGIDRDPDAVDIVYALGMTLKAAKKTEESIDVFRQVIASLNAGAVADRIRADMLRRLALGHINEITSGDWNLEKEIWQHVE